MHAGAFEADAAHDAWSAESLHLVLGYSSDHSDDGEHRDVWMDDTVRPASGSVSAPQTSSDVEQPDSSATITHAMLVASALPRRLRPDVSPLPGTVQPVYWRPLLRAPPLSA